MKTGTLYLIPTPLGETDHPCLLPQDISLLKHLEYFVVEAEKTARKHLKLLNLNHPIRELNLSVLNEHTADEDLIELLKPLLNGQDIGLMSEAGCPAIADPGAKLVALAHQYQIHIVPLTGPSSILLALMASGANGQNFTFKGYLPAEKQQRVHAIKQLSEYILKTAETQIFIETPYRNETLLADILQHSEKNLTLCVASALTTPQQQIISQTIDKWRNSTLPTLKKIPTIFIMYISS